MNKIAIVAVVLAGIAPQAKAGGKHHTHEHVKSGHVIMVSCYRGPWKEVIWDRPEPVFVESLVATGYDYSTANAMAERICRDRSLVDDREALRGTVKAMVESNPPSRFYRAHAPARR